MKDGTTKASARRRLIRGAFAAPAALTLYSGGVAAGSLSCVAAVVNHQPVTDADGSSTTFLRVPLREFVEVNGNGAVLARFVKALDLGMLLPVPPTESTSYLSPDQWQCFSSDSGNFEAGAIYTSDQIASGGLMLSPVPSSEYVAVRVSADGDIQGVQGLYEQGSAMFVSCWCSFGGDAPFNGN